MSNPIIIQGGMGVAVSNWRLARAVSQAGQLGVVSGTLISVVFIRRLQAGDTDGSIRRALSHFPVPSVAHRILDEYFIDGGKPRLQPYRQIPMPGAAPTRTQQELDVLANFTEVFLAKEGHTGLVGINLLEKIRFTTLPALYGAMLAGVDYVLMGAGIPRAIPGVLDDFAAGRTSRLRLDIEGAKEDDAEVWMEYDPRTLLRTAPVMKRPKFLAIVSSAALATTLARKSTGQVDGFVVEASNAGGHNAPPRGAARYNDAGEPIYGPRDEPEPAKFRELGLPFWLAGSAAGPEQLKAAQDVGAVGVQIGTAFAFCEESGLTPEIKREVCQLSQAELVRVHTDPLASPTGFPFKIVQLAETMASRMVYSERPRLCDLGHLRQSYRREDGSTGYRCPAEPVADFLRKGGTIEETEGRKCLCNGLLSAIGLEQHRRSGYDEPALVTAGEDVATVARFLAPGADTYRAVDVLNKVLGTAQDESASSMAEAKAS